MRAVLRVSFAVHVFLILFLAVSFSAAQARRPMTMLDLLEIPSLGSPELSPDGRELLYSLGETDWAANGQRRRVLRMNLNSGEVNPLTRVAGARNAIWSPDGRWIAFLARPEGSNQPQIYLMSAEQPPSSDAGQGQAEGEPITSLDTIQSRPDLLAAWGTAASRSGSVSNLMWSPDSAAIYFLAPEPATEEEKLRAETRDDIYAFDENYKQWHLWSVSLDDRSTERVTGGDYSVLSYELSRDGQKIVRHRGPTPLYQDPHRSELWVMDADGTNATQLTHNDVPEGPGCCGAGGARISPDNSQIAFLAKTNERFDYFYKSSLFLMPASGGEARLLLEDLPYELMQTAWSPDGRAIYFLANLGVHTELFKLDVYTEEIQQLTEGEHTIGSWAYRPSAGVHLFTVNEPTSAGDVWTLPEDGGTPTRLTRVYEYLDRDFELPRQEKIAWQGVDGVDVEGLLSYPLGYEEGTRYPLIVQSHGGMAASDKFRFGSWSTYIPVLAAKGYAVLRTNYRGSGGYGSEFQRDMLGRYFNNGHLDVMAGVDHVIEMGIADPDRLIKRGWSAGGYMTNKIITFTDRFKAASSGAGMVNWISFYSQSDIRYFRSYWLGGSPWQEDAPIDNFWEQSPLSRIADVVTPTIIFVGANDVRVPPQQSIELYRALKHNDVPTRLYIAPREPHNFGELRHRLFKMNAELEWFEKYAMEREYTWETTPSGS